MSVKDELLRELESHRGETVSGAALAQRLGVSRNAIWKAVGALRQDGHSIEAEGSRGYRLSADSDCLSEAGLRCFLPPELTELSIHVLAEVDSTNNEAKRLLAQGLSEEALIVAERQSAGRGRQGRSFYSPGGSGLYVTLLLHPQAELADALPLTTMAAVATALAIEQLTDKKPLIKWVNDLYLEGKKICGILTEAVADFESGAVNSVIVGIGVNISTADFPPELADSAGALHAPGLNRNQLAAAIAAQLFRRSRDLSDKSYLDEYRKRSLVIGRDIIYYQKNQKYPAFVVGIDDFCGLIIRLADGSERTLTSGEISIRLDD